MAPFHLLRLPEDVQTRIFSYLFSPCIVPVTLLSEWVGYGADKVPGMYAAPYIRGGNTLYDDRVAVAQSCRQLRRVLDRAYEDTVNDPYFRHSHDIEVGYVTTQDVVMLHQDPTKPLLWRDYDNSEADGNKDLTLFEVADRYSGIQGPIIPRASQLGFDYRHHASKAGRPISSAMPELYRSFHAHKEFVCLVAEIAKSSGAKKVVFLVSHAARNTDVKMPHRSCKAFPSLTWGDETYLEYSHQGHHLYLLGLPDLEYLCAMAAILLHTPPDHLRPSSDSMGELFPGARILVSSSLVVHRD